MVDEDGTEKEMNIAGVIEQLLNYNRNLLDYITNLQTIEQQYSAILSENAELENKITNLQEENKRLTQGVTLLTNKVIDMTKVKEDYKQRNEKAIEYIDDNTYYKDHKGHINIDDVYMILQGKSD